MAVLCVSCSRDDARKSILKVYNWADYIDESLLSEFEEWYFEQTGEEVEVVYQLFDINEIMLAKIERGKEDFDVVCPSEYIIERMLKNDLLLPINKDFGTTPNYLGNVSPFISMSSTRLTAVAKMPMTTLWATCGVRPVFSIIQSMLLAKRQAHGIHCGTRNSTRNCLSKMPSATCIARC